jgi:hypothetical protein
MEFQKEQIEKNSVRENSSAMAFQKVFQWILAKVDLMKKMLKAKRVNLLVMKIQSKQ